MHICSTRRACERFLKRLVQEDIRKEAGTIVLGQKGLVDRLFLLRTDVAEHYLNAGSYGGAYKCGISPFALGVILKIRKSKAVNHHGGCYDCTND